MDPKVVAERLHVDPKRAEKGLKTTRDWLLMVGAILYVLSPLDLIPEAVFGVFGLLDDAVVVLLAFLFYLSKHNTGKSWADKFKRS